MQNPNTHALRSAIRSVPYRIAVLLAGSIAIGSLAMNYTDNRSTVGYTQVCFKPDSEVKNPKIKYCTASQRYWIADPILKRWEVEQPEFYGKLTRLKSRPAENTNKSIYGFVAMAGGLVVAGLGASRLNLINRLAPGYRKETHAQWHRDSVRNGVQMASDAIKGQYAVGQLIYQHDINAGRAQAAYLTPQEIQAQIEQAQWEQAYLEGQQQADALHREQGQLPGQSMEQVANPGDKVQSANTHAHSAIKPALIQALEQSEISPSLKAGLLKVIGGQGSGKTTMVNGGLLRYRVHLGHKLIIINPHKKFEMYKGLEPYMEAGTEFYGVGGADSDRATSLVAGMKKVLSILEARYTEYQTKPEGSYNHYPITVLLEECGEWSGLLGEKGLPLIQHFWQKIFISCRKAKIFPIITAQDDTMTMFGNPKGLADLIKNSGAVTLNLFAKPDSSSPDGWVPTGQGALYCPNQDVMKVCVPDIRNLVPNPDIFTDLIPQVNQPDKQATNENKTKLKLMRELIADCWVKDDDELSEPAQKLIGWMRKKYDEGMRLFVIRDIARSGCLPNIKTDQIKEVLQELITANIVSVNDGGEYTLRT